MGLTTTSSAVSESADLLIGYEKMLINVFIWSRNLVCPEWVHGLYRTSGECDDWTSKDPKGKTDLNDRND